MLGNSSTVFNACIQQVVNLTRLQKILELGCGQGKFGELLKQSDPTPSLTGVQKMFSGGRRRRSAKEGLP